MTPRPEDASSNGNSSQIEQLRTALAINRGMEFLQEELPRKMVGKTEEHHTAIRIRFLQDLYGEIHEAMFKNWKQGEAPVRMIDDPRKRQMLRSTIETLCAPNGHHSRDEPQSRYLFDSNGQIIGSYSREELAELLGNFYGKVREIAPFNYGNELTLNMFMTALGELPAFKANYGKAGINFLRMNETDYNALHAPHLSAGSPALVKAFLHAMDDNLTPLLRNDPSAKDALPPFPKSVEYVSGIRFLSYKSKKHGTCLVTVNGGLVPLEDIKPALESEIESNKLLAKFTPVKPVTDEFVPHTESLRNKQDIDCIPITEKGAPLVCLDFNIMTGLRDEGHKALLTLLRKNEKLTDLANNRTFRDTLLDRAGESSRMRDSIEVAYERLSQVVPRLDRLRDEIITDLKPEEYDRVSELIRHTTGNEKASPIDLARNAGLRDRLLERAGGDEAMKRSIETAYMRTTKADASGAPYFMESFGGGGVGKTFAQDIMRMRCGGDNFVMASLDAFRDRSDLYKVVTEAGHHADDYQIVEPFANALRTWVSDKARSLDLNVFYDGTGIPFKPRYSDLAREFKKKGYATEIVGVDAPLGAAINRSLQRFRKKNRALQWMVLIGKHVFAPSAFKDALETPDVDKISLFATDGKEGEHYLIGETFPQSQNAVTGAIEDPAARAEFMRQRALSDPQAIMPKMAGFFKEKITDLARRIPGFSNGDDNMFTQSIVLGGGSNRDFAIYDVKRYRQFVEKRQFNAHAANESGFVVPYFEDMPFMLRTQKQWQDRSIHGNGGSPGRA